MVAPSSRPDWIAVDWGTTHLRGWAMTADGDVIASAKSDRGMSGLTADGYEPALLALVDGWLPDAPIPVVACGMVGARQGWIEASYAAVPCVPVGVAFASPQTIDARLDVHVIPGIKQITPPDVMRGEETQIAGYLHLNPGFDGILCLPGTHTKWVRISEGLVSAFRTVMTGELYACLSSNTVLRHSVDAEGWDDAAFTQAVDQAISRPERLAAELFSIRAESLLEGLSPSSGNARLSGLLIGIELASVRAYWLGQKVSLIGDAKLTSIYKTALAAQGVSVEMCDADLITGAGLFAAYRNLRKDKT